MGPLAKNSVLEQMSLVPCPSYKSVGQVSLLDSISFLSKVFGVPVGLSDHTTGIHVPIAAVALGACMVEKHLTLSRVVSSPDSAFSLEPHEFKQMIQAVRDVEKALGGVRLGLTQEERKSRMFRRSLYVVEDVRKGEKLSKKNIRSIRPAGGLHPRHYGEVIGCETLTDLKKGTALQWEHLRKK